MKGYRADTYSQIETLVFMAFFERAHAVFCRNLQAQIEEPVLADMVGRIALDEERHEEFFANLVAYLVANDRDATVAAIAKARCRHRTDRCGHRGLPGQGPLVAESGIFDDAALKKVLSDRINRMGRRGRSELANSSPSS